MLKDKAVANLKAGEALLRLGLVDPAASRLYYSLYQAAVHAFKARGWLPGSVRSGAVEWSHDMVLGTVRRLRGRREDMELYDDMRELRRKADYDDDAVWPGELAVRIDAVRDFVEEVTS